MIGKPTKCSNHGRVRYKVDWRDAHGKRHEQFFATRAEAEARQAVVNAMPHVELHPLGDPACTLREYGAHWLAANASRWKHRTYISARAALEHHVHPFQDGDSAADRARGRLRPCEGDDGRAARHVPVDSRANVGAVPPALPRWRTHGDASRRTLRLATRRCPT